MLDASFELGLGNRPIGAVVADEVAALHTATNSRRGPTTSEQEDDQRKGEVATHRHAASLPLASSLRRLSDLLDLLREPVDDLNAMSSQLALYLFDRSVVDDARGLIP